MTYRLLALAIASLLVLAACSGASSLDTTTTFAETTTTLLDETTTTAVEDTSVDDDSTTTTVPMFEPEGAPTTELNSFRATSLVDVEVGDNPVTVATEGTRVGDSFECMSTITVSGMTLENLAVVTPDEAWLDDGSGFVEVDPFAIEDLIVGCPVHPVFWVDFDTSNFPSDLNGEAEDFNGIPSQRIDFAEDIELAQSMSLAQDLAGASFDRMDVWLADDGGWIAGMYVDASLDAEAAAQAFGGLPSGEDTAARLIMDIQISFVDDPTLTIDVPTGD